MNNIILHITGNSIILQEIVNTIQRAETVSSRSKVGYREIYKALGRDGNEIDDRGKILKVHRTITFDTEELVGVQIVMEDEVIPNNDLINIFKQSILAKWIEGKDYLWSSIIYPEANYEEEHVILGNLITKDNDYYRMTGRYRFADYNIILNNIAFENHSHKFAEFGNRTLNEFTTFVENERKKGDLNGSTIEILRFTNLGNTNFQDYVTMKGVH